MSGPVLSVLIATYKRPALLRRALDACARQIGVPGWPEAVEIVVVDNDPKGSAAPVLEALRTDWAGPDLITVHERRPGISHARNTAVASARGETLVFLDDDQCPTPGWLAALAATAKATGASAVFGPVRAEVDGAAPEALRPFCAGYFGRSFDGLGEGADLTPQVARLGTQNSLFRRDRLPPTTPLFDLDLGRTGGEDSILLRRLVDAGGRLAWSPAAEVAEHVPAERCCARYLRRRRFRDGQIRSLSWARARPPRPLRVALWMAVGALQAGIYGLGWLWAQARGQTDRAAPLRAHLHGGLGKVLWMRPFRFTLYGG